MTDADPFALITAGAEGAGLATVAADGTVLDVWYPTPALRHESSAPVELPDAGSGAATPSRATTLADLAAAERHDPLRDVTLTAVETVIGSLADPPADTADAYLRLHLLSARLVRPRTINLDGIFASLPNNAWTSVGPVPPDQVEAVRLRVLAAGGRLAVFGIDKFPRMTDYVVPSGVRIAHADRVRLGAYLASGTTVMHEGFCNFNAGTLGTSMVEGRISQGVVVGDGSDVGGGASIMGTLSGGGKEQVTIGAGCLLGANSGVGISLGDDCVVEAGLYLTAGTKLLLRAPGANGESEESVLKARELSGTAGLLFRRNSLTGGVEAVPRAGSWGGLNAILHA